MTRVTLKWEVSITVEEEVSDRQTAFQLLDDDLREAVFAAARDTVDPIVMDVTPIPEEPQEDGAGYFDAGLLVDALKEHGLDANIWQSGGGTATLTIKQDPSHDEVLIGPGSYHWEDPRKSLLTTDELYYGLDAGEMEDTIDGTVAPGTSIPDAAKQIADAYKAHNKSEEN